MLPFAHFWPLPKRKRQNMQIKNWGFQIKCVSNGKTTTEQMKLYQIQLRLCVVSTVWGFQIKELGPVLMFFFGGGMKSWKKGTHFPPIEAILKQTVHTWKDDGPQEAAGFCLNHRFSAAALFIFSFREDKLFVFLWHVTWLFALRVCYMSLFLGWFLNHHV